LNPGSSEVFWPGTNFASLAKQAIGILIPNLRKALYVMGNFMESSSSIVRVRVYLKAVSVLLLCCLGVLFIAILLYNIVHAIAVLGILFIAGVIIYFPIYIGLLLKGKRDFFYSLPIALACYGISIYRFIVYEQSFRSCLDSPPSTINHLLFYCWSSVLIWEVYFCFVRKNCP
jgi:hypothetical protein